MTPYAAPRELMAGEAGRAKVLPGVTVHGMDTGKWLAKQRKPEVWQTLTDGQRKSLEQLGSRPVRLSADRLRKGWPGPR
jgi:hypothetical protein